MAEPLASDGLWKRIGLLLPPEPAKPRGDSSYVPDSAFLIGSIFEQKSGHPSGDAAPGTRIWQQDDLLAPLARPA